MYSACFEHLLSHRPLSRLTNSNRVNPRPLEYIQYLPDTIRSQSRLALQILTLCIPDRTDTNIIRSAFYRPFCVVCCAYGLANNRVGSDHLPGKIERCVCLTYVYTGGSCGQSRLACKRE